MLLTGGLQRKEVALRARRIRPRLSGKREYYDPFGASSKPGKSTAEQHASIRQAINCLRKKYHNVRRSIGGGLGSFTKARHGALLNIPVELCCNQYAFSYGPAGWHYWKCLIQSYLETEQPVQKQPWFRFINHIVQPDFSRLMTFHDPKLSLHAGNIPFGSYPWGASSALAKPDPQQFVDTSRDLGSQNYMWFESGPRVEQLCLSEFSRTIRLLHSVLTTGYRCFRPPLVRPLIRANGEVRFVSFDGAHRLATLAAIGCGHVIVATDNKLLPPIHEEDADNWLYVKSGLIDKQTALLVFGLYFQLNGRERAQFAGVL